MMFTAYIWCFVHNFIWPCDLDLRPFDLGGAWWINSLTYATNIQIFSILRLSIPELCVTQSDHITITWNSHCACAVSRDLSPGGKNYPHFWNPWPQFTYSLCHFQGATTKIKLCYMRKIAFIPLWRLQSSRRMRSITWPVHRGTPKTTRNNFLTPTYLLTIQLYGATVTIKVRPSLYWSISMLKRFSAAKKVQSKSVHKMAVFRKFKGLHINCGHQAPQKAHPWPERRILAYFS